MKKTISSNIGGIVFHVDEDAYDKLYDYLASIKQYFHQTEGGDEIVSDIENRIAEMIKNRMGTSRTVVTIEDIEIVIRSMGDPSEFADEEMKGKYQEKFTKKPIKRLYRDPDNIIVGGIGGGLGAYFGIDPLWFRIAFVVFTIAMGFGPILYFILWIAIPMARTTAEKLEMKGERINISNIERSLRNEFRDLEDRFNNFKKKRGNFHKGEYKENRDRGVEIIRNIIIGVFKVMLFFIGIFFIVIGFAVIIALFASFLAIPGFSFINNHDMIVTIPDILQSVLGPTYNSLFSLIGILLLIGIPVIMLLYHGVKLIFGIRKHSKYVRAIAFTLWLGGLVICVFTGIQGVSNYKQIGIDDRQELVSSSLDNALYLRVNDNINDFHDFFNIEDDVILYKDDYPQHLSTFKIAGRAKFVIEESDNDSIYIITRRIARGHDVEEANKNASDIKYIFQLTDSTLTLDEWFHSSLTSSWRGQKLKVIIKVPQNQKVVKTNSFFYN